MQPWTWLLVLCVATHLRAQTPPASTDPLRTASSIADVIGGNVIAVAPDGSRLATVDQDRQVAWIIDAETGKARKAPNRGSVQSVAVDSNGNTWLGLASGKIAHVDSDGAERQFEVSEHAIDGLSAVGGFVAWSSSGADRAGAIEARSGTALWDTKAALGGYREPRIFPSRDGRVVFVRTTSRRKGGRRVIEIHEARTGKEIGQIESYLSKRSQTMPRSLDSLFVAQREHGNSFRLVRLGLTDLNESVIDGELRGKHFVDLIASPRRRALAEGDFEDRGTVLYDLSDQTVRKHSIGTEGVMPVGFAQIAGNECLLTTAGPKRTGLSMWSITDGRPVAEDLEWARGKRIVSAGSALRGQRIWMQWWRASDGPSIEYHLELIRLPD